MEAIRLSGFEDATARFPWPGGARAAVMISFDFDAESLWLGKDPANEAKLTTMSMGRYGADVGVPRILELLKEREVPATFFVPGWTAEAHPRKVDAILNQGHEIGHHGYLHLPVDHTRPEVIAEEVARGLEALVKVTGLRPRGYRAPGAETCDALFYFLEQEGFLYDSSLRGNVVPYLHPARTPGRRPLVELPENPIGDDTVFGFATHVAPRPIFGKRQVLEIWNDEFEELCDWGGLFVLTLHPQVTGRALRFAQFREFLDGLLKRTDIWFARGEEVAEHAMRVLSSPDNA